ncbi:MAG: metallophosphoesterase [Actinomycetales bacterium]|nr:metallophosphoesterase [Actinomycetales bacterium]
MNVDASTYRATVRRGDPGGGGWRELELAHGEPYQQAPPAGLPLACLWHLSDLHVCDAESPARQEYLDRFADPDSPVRAELGDVGTYRPQEILTAQVAVTMVQTVNRHGQGPATGMPVDGVVITGDLTDNAQANELQWYQSIVAGGIVSPRSGDDERSSWVGSAHAAWDERYWHPDGPPAGTAEDLPMARFGYPRIPGLVEAARRDLVSPGLQAPWVSVRGNHDGLLQGTVPTDDRLRLLATGSERITGLPAGVHPLATAEAIPGHGPARYLHDQTAPRTPIPADPGRALLESGDFPARTRDDVDAPNYFTTDLGALRVIALDTVNPHGGWQGSIDEAQLGWLVGELQAAADRYVVIASHHPSPSMTNAWAPGGADRRVLGPEVIEVLLDHPQVIAWMAGHIHAHGFIMHRRQERALLELTTASLIDWPQQGRILEFVRTRDEGRACIAIVSTVMNHIAPVTWDPHGLDDPGNLAAISRVLAANDYQLRDGSIRSIVLDSFPAARNTTWLVPDPHAR